jgi:hypothetical protein
VRGPSPPGTPHPSWRKSPHFVKIPPLEDSMAHAGTAADQLRPSSGGAMPSPVANAWVRPLKGTVAARNGNGSAGAAPRNPNGHSAVRAGGTKNGHGHDRVKDQHDDPHATAEPHPTKTKTVAPPPTNPWKTPMVEGVSSNIPPFPHVHFPGGRPSPSPHHLSSFVLPGNTHTWHRFLGPRTFPLAGWMD